MESQEETDLQSVDTRGGRLNRKKSRINRSKANNFVEITHYLDQNEIVVISLFFCLNWCKKVWTKKFQRPALETVGIDVSTFQVRFRIRYRLLDINSKQDRNIENIVTFELISTGQSPTNSRRALKISALTFRGAHQVSYLKSRVSLCIWWIHARLPEG